MNFAQAVQTQEARTQNGMKAHAGTGNACVDLFYKIGAMRNQDPVPAFTQAYAESEELALRIAQWARDVRGGSGEREIFRKILVHLEKEHPEAAEKLLKKIPEIGRWDDIFVFRSEELRKKAFDMLGDALREKNGLAAKWTPRQGPIAVEIRKHFGMSPKFYRKSLVALTQVVETQMCSKKWDEINFSHVPSVAAARYKKAFLRNAPVAYTSYVEKLAKGDTTVKINANAIFPHDVLKGVLGGERVRDVPQIQLQAMEAQWNALPDYVGDSSVLAMIDVSGSMYWTAISPGMYPGTIAQSLGLYVADKNRGPFKDTFMTFASNPSLVHVKGSIIDKIRIVQNADVGGSTDVIAGFKKILEVAKKGNVAEADMPKTLLILSDMQFNSCVRMDRTAMQALEGEYAAAGYKVPQVVFWNLQDKGTTPVTADKSGAALVSGFSPAILGSILGSSEDFSPHSIMLKAIMSDRYAL
jgi:hypothetical protein